MDVYIRVAITASVKPPEGIPSELFVSRAATVPWHLSLKQKPSLHSNRDLHDACKTCYNKRVSRGALT